MDTCAYIGGVVDELELHKDKVFAVNTETISADLNHISRQLNWGKSFYSLPHIHEYEKPDGLTHISNACISRLRGFLELTGEGPL